MKFVHIGEIIEYCQAEAIANRFNMDAVARWKRFCRDYSKKFFTPYHLVLKMDPEFVILSIYEEELDEVDTVERVHDLMDRIYSIEDPNYEKSKEEELKEFIDEALEEEQNRLKDGKPVFQGKSKNKKTAKQPNQELPKGLPTSGGVNLSYLQDMDKEE